MPSRILRSIPAILAAIALLMAGCGTTEDPSAPRPAGGAPITVVDARGVPVRLEGPATRVAATEWNGAEDLAALGVEPVGVADLDGYRQYVGDAAPIGGSARDIGTRGEPSLEALGSLDLDLVVVTDGLPQSALAQLERRVPVLVIKGGDPRDQIGAMFQGVDLIARATGTEQRAAQLRSEFDGKIAAARAAVQRAGAAGQQVAFSDAYVTAGNVTIRPYTAESLVGSVFARIGLRSAWRTPGSGQYGIGTSDVEGLTGLPDVRFWYLAESGGDPYRDVLAGNEIWRSLPFVRSGKVQRLPGPMWTFGGPASMEKYVDAAVHAL